MRALFTTWEGGGHVPAALMVAAQMRARGWEVLLVSDEATRPAARQWGLGFAPWTRAPSRRGQGMADDPLRDWRARTPPGVIKAICEAVMCGPAGDYGLDTRDLIARFEPDIVVSNELLFGVMAAAESAHRPLALLTGNIWCFPTREDLPPFGPGFASRAGRFGDGRNRTVRALIARWFDQGLVDLNAGRARLGLGPLSRVLDQLSVARLILLGTAQAFDFGGSPPPAPFVYAGPLISTPDWVRPAQAAPDGEDAADPLVLVSFSTAFQDQASIVARCVRALSRAPVRGLVTLGPAIDPGPIPRAPNVRVVASAPHDDIVPQCAAVICHAGHGTAIRPLLYGVPLLCLPTGRDQADNAARIVARGAGLRLSPRAGESAIHSSLMRLLQTPQYTLAAKAFGAAIRSECDGGVRAARAIAGLAARDSGASSEL